MPILGLGVYLSPPDLTTDAVQTAIERGYKLIDTAAAYGNEAQVGEGIRRSGAKRQDLFITTKLWIADFGFEQALRAFEVSLGKLGLDYLDLYLLHWPAPSTMEETIAAWQALVKLQSEGSVRAIGVCNFNGAHIERLTTATSVKPVVNQVELHPYFSQTTLRRDNAQRGIVTQAWSPIGGTYTNHPRDAGNVVRLLDDQTIGAIAGRLGKTTAQIVLRWHLQNGVAVIPKSANADRIAGNLEIFDFELSAADMTAIDALDTGQRNGPDPEVFDLAFIKARQEAQARAKAEAGTRDEAPPA